MAPAEGDGAEGGPDAPAAAQTSSDAPESAATTASVDLATAGADNVATTSAAAGTESAATSVCPENQAVPQNTAAQGESSAASSGGVNPNEKTAGAGGDVNLSLPNGSTAAKQTDSAAGNASEDSAKPKMVDLRTPQAHSGAVPSGWNPSVAAKAAAAAAAAVAERVQSAEAQKPVSGAGALAVAAAALAKKKAEMQAAGAMQSGPMKGFAATQLPPLQRGQECSVTGLPRQGVAIFKGLPPERAPTFCEMVSEAVSMYPHGACTFSNVDISGNRWSEEGISQLLSALAAFGCRVQRLKMYKACISDLGLQHLATYLEQLELGALPNEIHLSHNDITDVGFNALWRAVEKHMQQRPPKIPLWLRVEGNAIHPACIMDLVNRNLCCLATGRCNTGNCIEASWNYRPVVHMRFGTRQRESLSSSRPAIMAGSASSAEGKTVPPPASAPGSYASTTPSASVACAPGAGAPPSYGPTTPSASSTAAEASRQAMATAEMHRRASAAAQQATPGYAAHHGNLGYGAAQAAPSYGAPQMPSPAQQAPPPRPVVGGMHGQPWGAPVSPGQLGAAQLRTLSPTAQALYMGVAPGYQYPAAPPAVAGHTPAYQYPVAPGYPGQHAAAYQQAASMQAYYGVHPAAMSAPLAAPMPQQAPASSPPESSAAPASKAASATSAKSGASSAVNSALQIAKAAAEAVRQRHLQKGDAPSASAPASSSATAPAGVSKAKSAKDELDAIKQRISQAKSAMDELDSQRKPPPPPYSAPPPLPSSRPRSSSGDRRRRSRSRSADRRRSRERSRSADRHRKRSRSRGRKKRSRSASRSRGRRRSRSRSRSRSRERKSAREPQADKKRSPVREAATVKVQERENIQAKVSALFANLK